MKRLHIVGCPRSGTTLLLNLMSTCFHSDGYCQHEMSIFDQVDCKGELYISKQPNDIKQLRHIFKRDDSLCVIYLGRDPRAVITSQHKGHPGQYFCNYRVWRECDRAAQGYAGHPRFLYLRYETLVDNPDETQSHIAAHFPFLRRQHRFSEYHLFAQPSEASALAMQGLRAVSADGLDKWRAHLPRLAQQCQRYPGLADDLIRLGYEADRDWLTVLNGVTAIDYPCRYPENRQRAREWEKALRVYRKSRRYLRRMKDRC